MKKVLFPLFLLVVSLCAFSQTLVPKGTVVSPTDKHIQYIGRISFSNPERPEWTFPGVQIRSGFTGTSLKMIAKPNSGYFMAQINNAEPFKVIYNSQRDSVVTLATSLPNGIHQVKLMYVSEGYDRRPQFRGFIVDEGCTLADATPLPERKIEFIGNSITCGYGVESMKMDDPYLEETANHYYTYAARTAELLNAQHLVVARSGIGVYRNYDGPKSGNKINMNTEYAHTMLYNGNELWDFSRFIPHVVCINLGTNDTSTKGADEKLLLKGYKDLYNKVRSNYPNAKIVLLAGSMLNGEALNMVNRCLDKTMTDAHKAGDKEVFRFDFTPQNGDLKYGASWHPSYWQHEKMAGELTAYLRVIMNWF